MTDAYAAILPADLVDALKQLGGQIRAGKVDPVLVSRIVEGCGRLPLRRFDETSQAIRMLGGLYGQSFQIKPSPVAFWPRRGPSGAESALVRRTPGLATLFLLHASGWVRETALRRLQGPAPNAFWMAVLVHRLNDWVPQVRRAAIGAFHRIAAATPPAILAETAIALLDRTDEWSRWTDEAGSFRWLLARPDVQEEMVGLLKSRQNGPLARSLRRLLKGTDYDASLLDLARTAAQPAVRAVALETLLLGRARWLAGRERRWIDKSHGIWRHAPVFATRPVEPPCSFDELARLGLEDKAAAVRKVVASALVQRPECARDLEQMASRLRVDRNPAIRERAEFVLRRLRQAD